MSFIMRILKKTNPFSIFENIKLNLGIKTSIRRGCHFLNTQTQKLIAIKYFINYIFEIIISRKISPELKILDGPFANLKYPRLPKPSEHFSTMIPKLLGCYESELNSVVQGFISAKYETIVNIGSDDGYYSVGLGKLLPKAQVYCFEINPLALKYNIYFARFNNVFNNNIVGKVTKSNLAKLVKNGKKTLIVCDCEGCEEKIIDIKSLSELSNADILVEVHNLDHFKRNLKGFKSTHKILKINYKNNDKPIKLKYWFFSFNYLVSEMRSPNVCWFMLKRKN